jgi:hypothetical protein
MNASDAAHLSQHESDCLTDASEGRRVAPTRDSTQVLCVDERGAVLHHEDDITRLVAAGWLCAEGAGYEITTAGRAALSLPVQE